MGRQAMDVDDVSSPGFSLASQSPANGFISNADRIKRGLPLNPPRRRSDSLVARDPVPSPAIGTTGRLYITGPTNGYISATLDAQGRYVVTQDGSQALRIRIYKHELIPIVSLSTSRSPLPR